MHPRTKEMLTYLAAGFLAALIVLLALAAFHRDLVKPFTEHYDHAIQAWVHAHSSPSLTPWMKLLTEIGAPRTDIPLCALIAALLWWQKQRRQAALLLSSMLGAGLLVTALKLHFKRTRPDLPWSIGHEHTYSFPSGHSVMAVVLYGTLLYLLMRSLGLWWQRTLASAVALALALAIGYSRVYLGAHFPSDVAAGYFCGSIWLAAIILGDLFVRRELQTWLRTRTTS